MVQVGRGSGSKQPARETVRDLGDRRDMHTDGRTDVHTKGSQQV